MDSRPGPKPRPYVKTSTDRGSALNDRPGPDARATSNGPAPDENAAEGLVRLSKLMAEKGLCSRREADHYIEKGLVYVNGQRITVLGTKVDPLSRVTLDTRALESQKNLATILVNKPVGYVSAQPEDGYEPAVILIKPETHFGDQKRKLETRDFDGLAVAGRLDIDSQGLLVFTQDGRMAKKLIGENSAIEKEYLVRVQGALPKSQLELLRYGLSLDGQKLKPAQVTWQNEDQLKMILKEGKKRQIRRMCEAVGLKVLGLKRVRIGNIKLGNLPEGQWRYLEANESFD